MKKSGESSASTPSSPIYKPLTTRALYEGVVQQIAQQIVGGVLIPGAALPIEPDLARQFGVSRTVIREAIRMLASKGLVTVRHGSGTRVQSSDKWNYLDPLVLFEQVRSGAGDELLAELLELRGILEAEVAALAAIRRSEEDLAVLADHLSEMRLLISNPEAFTQFDIRFHARILSSARNRPLRDALRPVAHVLEAGRFISVKVPGGIEQSLLGHESIYLAIANQDSATAREAMANHVHQFKQNIRAALLPEASSRTVRLMD